MKILQDNSRFLGRAAAPDIIRYFSSSSSQITLKFLYSGVQNFRELSNKKISNQFCDTIINFEKLDHPWWFCLAVVHLEYSFFSWKRRRFHNNDTSRGYFVLHSHASLD